MSGVLRLVAAGVASLAALLCAACGIADRSYLRVGGTARSEYAPPENVRLAEKAARFEDGLESFLSPDGLLAYQQRTGQPFRYRLSADAAIWTGSLLGAECLRHAVTGEAAALDRVRRLVAGLHKLHEITGVPGLFARSYAPGAPEERDGDQVHAGGGALAGFKWKGDVSKDQVAGLVFGYGVASLHIEDVAVRRTVAADAAALADHLIRNDLRLVDVDGETTTHGNLRGRIACVPIGLNALIALAAFKVAHHASGGEERFARAYDDLIDRGYHEIAYWAKFQVLGKTNQNNDNMQFLALYPLLRLETDPAIRRAYIRSAERTWRYIRFEGNAFFNFVTALALGPALEGAQDDALLTLRLFPLDKRSFEVDLREDPRFERTFFKNRKGRVKAVAPLPINYRTQTAWAWRDDPYALISGEGREGEEVYPGADYLLAYWLGRYHGFVAPSD